MKKLIPLFLLLFALVFTGFTQEVQAKECPHGKQANCCKVKGAKKNDSACGKCAETCTKTISYLKKKGGKGAEADNIKLLEDCAALCRLNADFQNRGSANAAKVKALCKEICLQCAQMCKSLGDEKLKDCVESCLQCADCCSEEVAK